MKKLFKVILWGVGIVVVLFIILIGVGVYLASDNSLKEAQKEGVGFASNASKEDCLAETAIKLARCESALCLDSLNFGGMCLVYAKGNQQEFCADKPTSDAEYSIGSWQTHCTVNSLSKHNCEMLYKTFSAYCRGEFDQ